GAVNTAIRKGNRWTGANTDESGFLAALEQSAKFDPRGKKILVLGAGGSARAVIYGLSRKGARLIQIANRHEARAKKIAKDFSPEFKRTEYKIAGLAERDL